LPKFLNCYVCAFECKRMPLHRACVMGRGGAVGETDRPQGVRML
jgi:hypothetical protein